MNKVTYIDAVTISDTVHADFVHTITYDQDQTTNLVNAYIISISHSSLQNGYYAFAIGY